MQKRNEIDGLRAVAVLPVILFHAGFDTFSGGFVGVDVFFVISGYLITTIIYDEVREGTFSILRFYERRIRRILPALFLVSVACIPFAWMWMLPHEFKDFSQSLVAINLFASNILFWRESGYFAAATELKPLLHTWSLSVEEQFYLFFPPLLLFCASLGRTALLVILVIVSMLSLGLAQWASGSHPTANFYLLPTRAWELGVGAIIAISAPHWRNIEGRAGAVLAWLGLGMVLYSVFSFDHSTPFPSVWACVPVFGTGLIIAFARPINLTGQLLSWWPLVGLGLISYSAYLWHQPLFAFARIRLFYGVNPAVYLILSVASIGLAYLSWRYVENPLRRSKSINCTALFIGAGSVSCLIIGFGLWAHLKDGVPNRFTHTQSGIKIVSASNNPTTAECHGARKMSEACVYGNSLYSAALWGDSHANVIANILASKLNGEFMSLRQFTEGGCIPSTGIYRSDGVGRCAEFNREVLKYLLDEASEEVIVLAGRYPLRLEGSRFNNLEGGMEPGTVGFHIPFGEGLDFIKSAERISTVGKHYRSPVEQLLKSGKKVVLVYPIPEVGWHVPDLINRQKVFPWGLNREPVSTSYTVFLERTKNARDQLNMLEDHPNLIRIYPDKLLCNTEIAGRCIAELDGMPLYFDDDHLSNEGGAPMLAEEIVRAMDSAGWLPASNGESATGDAVITQQ